MKRLIPVPVVNANDEFVVLVRWHVADGGQVVVGAPLVDVETTKAVMTIEAEHAGWVRHVARENTEVAIGAPLAVLVSEEYELAEALASLPGTSREPSEPLVATPVQSEVEPAATTVLLSSSSEPAINVAANFTRLSPQAEALAAQLGLARETLLQANLGLVTAADVRALIGKAADNKKAAPESAGKRSERVSLSKRAEIAALSTGAEGGLRSSLTVYLDSAGLRASEGGASLLSLILSETARLLVVRPRFTAFYENGQVQFHDAVHLGVAMDQGEGLRVVTVRDADKLPADEIAAKLGDLALDYMEHRLRAEDVEGSTFTVTDLTAFDVLHFEPLINGRQAAILALGADSALPGHPMALTLAFDHRVLTGREVAEFLKALRDALLAHLPVATSETPCCDRCMTDVESYYDRFGAVGVMHHYARRDGSTGLICHACLLTM